MVSKTQAIREIKIKDAVGYIKKTIKDCNIIEVWDNKVHLGFYEIPPNHVVSYNLDDVEILTIGHIESGICIYVGIHTDFYRKIQHILGKSDTNVTSKEALLMYNLLLENTNVIGPTSKDISICFTITNNQRKKFFIINKHGIL